jgi:hypothetical protein
VAGSSDRFDLPMNFPDREAFGQSAGVYERTLAGVMPRFSLRVEHTADLYVIAKQSPHRATSCRGQRLFLAACSALKQM